MQSKVRTVYIIEAKFHYTYACNAANSLGVILYNKHGVSGEERATVADPEGTRSSPLKHTMQGSTQNINGAKRRKPPFLYSGSKAPSLLELAIACWV